MSSEGGTTASGKALEHCGPAGCRAPNVPHVAGYHVRADALTAPLLLKLDSQEDELADAGLERRNNTLFLGAAVVGGSLNMTSSAEQCAQRCSELLLCAAWAWCPTEAPTG